MTVARICSRARRSGGTTHPMDPNEARPHRSRSAWRLRTTGALSVVGLLAATVLFGAASPAHAATTVISSEHMSVEISPAQPEPGDQVTIKVTTVNDRDSDDSSGVYLELPDGVTNPFAAGTCTLDQGLYPTSECSADSVQVNGIAVDYSIYPDGVPAHSTSIVTITTTMDPNASPGPYAFTARGSFWGAEEHFTPSALVIGGTPPAADLAVSLKATAPLLLAGYIDYTQTTTTNGPATADSATVTTQLHPYTTSVTGLPAGCAYAPAGKKVTCTLTALADAAGATKTFRAHVAPLTIGLHVNATATRTTGSPGDPDPANDTATAHCAVVTGLIVLCRPAAGEWPT